MGGFLVFVVIVVLGILGLVGGLSWIHDRRSARSLAPRGDGAMVGRLEGIESALSSLEARLEDLQQQQRFLERLLEERPRPPSLPAPGTAPDEAPRSILFDTDRESDAGEEAR
jgi:hypothetical protein